MVQLAKNVISYFDHYHMLSFEHVGAEMKRNIYPGTKTGDQFNQKPA